MQNLIALAPATATGTSKKLFNAIQSKLGIAQSDFEDACQQAK